MKASTATKSDSFAVARGTPATQRRIGFQHHPVASFGVRGTSGAMLSGTKRKGKGRGKWGDELR